MIAIISSEVPPEDAAAPEPGKRHAWARGSRIVMWLHEGG
jgi:hypothetical protein